MDYFLKAVTEVALNTALLNAGVTDDTGQVQTGYSLDVIGAIYQPTGESTEQDGIAVPTLAALSGYHANLRCPELTEAQKNALPLIDAPTSSVRVWA